MAGGEWFQVDMTSAKTFAGITLDSSTNDYPRGYSVFVSNDGMNWGGAITTGSASSAFVTIKFTQQTARYIRVNQTGAAIYWWSIREFNVWPPGSTQIQDFDLGGLDNLSDERAPQIQEPGISCAMGTGGRSFGAVGLLVAAGLLVARKRRAPRSN
jgi:hypothetical protein